MATPTSADRIPTGDAWTLGSPTAKQVSAHLDAHGWFNRDAQMAYYGCRNALWACWDPDQLICVPHATYRTLSVTDGDAVVIANGHTFWQPLAHTRWADRSYWRPVTREGFEVHL